MRYCVLSEATFGFEKKMEKKEFRVLIKYCFLKGKNTVEEKNGLIKSFRGLHQENQQSLIGMLSLNVVK